MIAGGLCDIRRGSRGCFSAEPDCQSLIRSLGRGKGTDETVEVVVAVQEVDPFCLVPGESLGDWQTLFSCVVVGEGDDAGVEVDGVP